MSQIVGILSFSRSELYTNLSAFHNDSQLHRIAPSGSKTDWDGEGKMYAWYVGSCRRLSQPIPLKGKDHVTKFRQKQRYTVTCLGESATAGYKQATPEIAEDSSQMAKASATDQGGAVVRRRPASYKLPKATTAARHKSAASHAPVGKRHRASGEPDEREGLFFDPQVGAWCGMHALNNYCLAGGLVDQAACRAAVRLVVQRLSQTTGDVERAEEHLHPETGWLSIDVINVLGEALLGLHVDGAAADWNQLQGIEEGAAFVNWNNTHWTVLQRDSSGEGWMHTNSIEGEGASCGRRRRLSNADVCEILAAVVAKSGAVSLHKVSRSQTQGQHFLEAAGRQAMAGPDVIEGDQHVPSVSDVDMISIVSLNVDGLGDYSDPPDVRMGAILTRLLVVEPDLLSLQEVTMPMLACLQQKLPEWHVRRMRSVCEDYFNVIATREPMEARSFPYPSSMNGRHLVYVRGGGWSIFNTHAESGSRDLERDAREQQLLHLSRVHEQEEDRQICVLAGDLNVRVGETHVLEAEGWRDVWNCDPHGRVDFVDWTWSRGARAERYDRILVHSASCGDAVECKKVSRIDSVWPALTDHVALHAVLSRDAPPIVVAPVDTPASVQAPVAVVAPVQTPVTVVASVDSPVTVIGNDVVKCAASVRHAGCAALEDFSAEGRADLPKWSSLPKDCKFKTEKIGGRKKTGLGNAGRASRASAGVRQVS